METIKVQFKKIVAFNKRGVDMRGLQGAVSGMVAVFITAVLGAILTDQLGNTTGLGNAAVIVADNATDIIGDVVTTWGNIILLGVVAVFVFIGVLAALNFLTARQGR